MIPVLPLPGCLSTGNTLTQHLELLISWHCQFEGNINISYSSSILIGMADQSAGHGYRNGITMSYSACQAR